MSPIGHDIYYVIGMVITCDCGVDSLGIEGRKQHLAEVTK